MLDAFDTLMSLLSFFNDVRERGSDFKVQQETMAYKLKSELLELLA
jgi:hypothetical protein